MLSKADGTDSVLVFSRTKHGADKIIHRIGRTGRAGETGDAITFIAPEEVQHLRKIEKFIGKRFEVGQYPGFTPSRKDTTGVHVSRTSGAGGNRGHHRLPGKTSPEESRHGLN
jgi:superfamily II DNA/RNA helicase